MAKAPRKSILSAFLNLGTAHPSHLWTSPVCQPLLRMHREDSRTTAALEFSLTKLSTVPNTCLHSALPVNHAAFIPVQTHLWYPVIRLAQCPVPRNASERASGAPITTSEGAWPQPVFPGTPHLLLLSSCSASCPGHRAGPLTPCVWLPAGILVCQHGN